MEGSSHIVENIWRENQSRGINLSVSKLLYHTKRELRKWNREVVGNLFVTADEIDDSPRNCKGKRIGNEPYLGMTYLDFANWCLIITLPIITKNPFGGRSLE